MGLKGAVESGFPEPKPAFTLTLDWDAPHALGGTTHPKNQLSYVKLQGSIKTVNGSGLPPFEANIVDSGSWVQQDYQPGGEAWMTAESFALLKVVEQAGASVDPETETGLIRMKWRSIGNFPRLKAALARDNEFEETIRKDPQGASPRGTVDTFSFETGDHRYKALEHAVYIGKCRLVVSPPQSGGGKPRVLGEYHISYVAA